MKWDFYIELNINNCNLGMEIILMSEKNKNKIIIWFFVIVQF